VLGRKVPHGLGIGARLAASIDRGNDEAVSLRVEQGGREGEPPPHVLERVVSDEGEALKRLAGERRLRDLGALHVLDPLVEVLDLPSRVAQGGDDVAVLGFPPQHGVFAAQLSHPKRQGERQQDRNESDEGDASEPYEERVSGELGHVASSYTRVVRPQEVRDLLDEMRSGATTVDEALAKLRRLPYDDLGFARLDTHRELRQGMPEAIYAAGKTAEQTVAIARRLVHHSSGPVLVTHSPAETASALLEAFPDARYSEAARLVVVPARAHPNDEKAGVVVVVSAGTSDLPVAEEAAVTAEALGAEVERIADVGVAGLHRLLEVQDRLHAADVVIVVAGMEGALASLVGGITSAPVVAVPTSVGYGASFEGLAALLAMLNSCAAGVAVFNVDNGFGAATFALRMLHRRR
jgi:NCAIR mutase (PurE)-related protein